MKKLLFLSGLAMLLAMSSCAKKDAEAPKTDDAAAAQEAEKAEAPKDLTPQQMADSVEFTVDGLKTLFKNNPLTADEYEAYMLSYAKCEFKENNGFYNYKDCPAKQLALSSGVPGIAPKEMFSVLSRLIKHENAIVRDRAYDELYFGEDTIATIMAALKEEKDPKVELTFFVRLCSSSLLTNPEVAPYIKSRLKGDDANFRMQFFYNAMPKNVKDDPEYVAIISDMCQNDPDEEVKNKACERLPQFQAQE